MAPTPAMPPLPATEPPRGVQPLALLAAAVFAVDPQGLGGLRLRGGAGPARDAWLTALHAWLPAGAPWARLPVSIAEDRLLGGLDLAASLVARRSVLQRGLLADCHGGGIEVPMAERLPARTAALICAALDAQEVVVERDGFALRHPARLAVLALDEALPGDEPLAAALADRMAIDVALDRAPDEGLDPARDPARDRPTDPLPAGAPGLPRDAPPRRGAATLPPPGAAAAWPLPDAAAIAAARSRLASVSVPMVITEALCQATLALGVDSARAAWFALHVARIAAALAGRDVAGDADARLAAALVLAPRATRLPAPQEESAPTQDADVQPMDASPPDAAQAAPREREPAAPPPAAEALAEAPSEEPVQPLQEQLVAAALAALPPALLAQLAAGAPPRLRSRAASEGRAGALSTSRRRGAPLGARPGDPRRGERLSLVDTIRAAIPWQRLRTGAQTSTAVPTSTATAPRLALRISDLRVMRRAHHQRSTTLFVIDASGSSALHRLAEAKGAVEQLLAESYVRRDEVAVIAFRGQGAELLLPPTRSLVRAKRALAGLPGGGGTPLAAALDAAEALLAQVQRRGASAGMVLLTDGRANVPRVAGTGRVQAEADALAAARVLAARGARALLIDTSPRPTEAAARLAEAMHARYLPLPHVRADLVSAAVKGLVA